MSNQSQENQIQNLIKSLKAKGEKGLNFAVLRKVLQDMPTSVSQAFIAEVEWYYKNTEDRIASVNEKWLNQHGTERAQLTRPESNQKEIDRLQDKMNRNWKEIEKNG